MYLVDSGSATVSKTVLLPFIVTRVSSSVNIVLPTVAEKIVYRISRE